MGEGVPDWVERMGGDPAGRGTLRPAHTSRHNGYQAIIMFTIANVGNMVQHEAARNEIYIIFYN